MTGREVLIKVAGVDGDRIADAVRELGYICVPIHPTESMLTEAYWDAPGEDIKGVWASMVEASETSQ